MHRKDRRERSPYSKKEKHSDRDKNWDDRKRNDHKKYLDEEKHDKYSSYHGDKDGRN